MKCLCQNKEEGTNASLCQYHWQEIKNAKEETLQRIVMVILDHAVQSADLANEYGASERIVDACHEANRASVLRYIANKIKDMSEELTETGGQEIATD